LYDRLTEIFPIAILALIALPALKGVVQKINPAIARGVVGIVVALGFWLGFHFVRSLRERLAALEQPQSEDGRKHPSLLIPVGYACLLWIQDVLRLAAATSAFGISLKVSELAALSVITVAGGLIPTIGGLGTTEGGLTAALYAFGVPLETAMAVTL